MALSYWYVSTLVHSLVLASLLSDLGCTFSQSINRNATVLLSKGRTLVVLCASGIAQV